MGDASTFEHRGIAPRALSHLFHEINSRTEIEFMVTCTYIEIYNDKIYDLLVKFSDIQQSSDYTIVEEKDGRGTIVRGVNEVEIKCEADALNVLFSGELARTTGANKLNRRSNRSHCIFTVFVQQRFKSGVNEKVKHSKICLCDLAGSERLGKTTELSEDFESDSILRKESMSINQSLTFLEQCVVALQRKNVSSNHIPFRQSKLTNILKDCIGANCKTLMFACIWGEVYHLEETISTLRFASRMIKVQNESISVETVNPSVLVKKQAKMIKALKQELMMHDALNDRSNISYEPYTPELQESINVMIKRYIEADETEEEDVLDIKTYRDMIEICKQFKKIIIQKDSLYHLHNNETALTGKSHMIETTQEKVHKNVDSKTIFVGSSQEEFSKSFSVGNSLSNSRPLENFKLSSPEKMKVFTSSFNSGQLETISPDGLRSPSSVKFDFPNFNTIEGGFSSLLKLFIEEDGKLQFSELQEIKNRVKYLTEESKNCQEYLRLLKLDVDELSSVIETRFKVQDSNSNNDENLFIIQRDLREKKLHHKLKYELLLKLKADYSQAIAQLQNIQEDLASNFNEWICNKRNGVNFNLSGSIAYQNTSALNELNERKDPSLEAFYQAQKTKKAINQQNSSTIREVQRMKRFK